MQVKVQYPPNIDKIILIFPRAADKGILFAYGDYIYNPSNVTIPIWLYEHELTHSRRQAGNPEAWWDSYLSDRKFRLAEELIAHQVEFQAYVRNGHNRQQRRGYLKEISKRLSSELYGKLITKERARLAILAELHTQNKTGLAGLAHLPVGENTLSPYGHENIQPSNLAVAA